MVSRLKLTKESVTGILIVVLSFVFILLLAGIGREFWRQKDMKREISTLENELTALNSNHKKFLQSLEDYQSDYFVEQEARQKLNLRQAGETVAVVNLGGSNNREANPLNSGQAVSVGNQSNLLAWWDYFFGAEL